MNDQTLFKRIAAVSAILAAPVQLVFMIIGFLAIDFNAEIMADQLLGIKHKNQAYLSAKEFMMKRIIVWFALVAIALSGCTPKPEQVAPKLVEGVNSQDIEGALAIFAEDAVVNTGGPTTYTGTVEIRGWLEELAEANFELKAEIVEVNGDTVVEHETITWIPGQPLASRRLRASVKSKFKMVSYSPSNSLSLRHP